MPRGKRKADASPTRDVNASRLYYCASEAPWGGYVNLRVSEDERQDFDDWTVEEAASLGRYLETATVEGLKLSVTYDAENSSYIATFTGAGCHGDKARYCLTARSSDLTEAINLLLYKHLVLLDGDWGAYAPSTGRAVFG